MSQNDVRQFRRRIDQVGDCLIWKGTKTSRNEAIIWGNDGTTYAAHVVCDLAGVKRVNSFLLGHTCENVRCLNVEHFRQGEPRRNDPLYCPHGHLRIMANRYYNVADDGTVSDTCIPCMRRRNAKRQ